MSSFLLLPSLDYVVTCLTCVFSTCSGLRYLSFVSLHRVPSWASGSLGYNLRFRSGLFVLSRSGLLRSVLRRVLDSDRVVASIFFLRSVSRVFLLSATVSCFVGVLGSAGVFDRSVSSILLLPRLDYGIWSSCPWCPLRHGTS